MARSASPAAISGITASARAMASSMSARSAVGGAFQRIIDHTVGTRTGPTHTDAQTQKILFSTEGGDDVAQTVMPTRTATTLQTYHTRRQIDLVVHDQHLFGWHLIMARAGATA